MKDFRPIIDQIMDLVGAETPGEALEKVRALLLAPVDRVRAMAALVECHGDTYIVAGDEVGLSDDDRLYCLCCYEFDCEHAQAVELYLKQEAA